MLGLALNLPLHDVEAIHSQYRNPKECLLHVIIAFLEQAEPRPTWSVIVEALKSPTVNLTALAKEVESAHFPDLTLTREVVPETTGKSPSYLTGVATVMSLSSQSPQSLQLILLLVIRLSQSHLINLALYLVS